MLKKKKYQINEDDLKQLLYNNYLLEMLEDAGINNWLHYGENFTEFIANCLNISTSEAYDRDLGIEDIVEKEIKKYKRG